MKHTRIRYRPALLKPRELTERQVAIVMFMHHYLAEFDNMPTRADIAAAFGFASTNAAEMHIRALERHRVLECMNGRQPRFTRSAS